MRYIISISQAALYPAAPLRSPLSLSFYTIVHGKAVEAFPNPSHTQPGGVWTVLPSLDQKRWVRPAPPARNMGACTESSCQEVCLVGPEESKSQPLSPCDQVSCRRRSEDAKLEEKEEGEREEEKKEQSALLHPAFRTAIPDYSSSKFLPPELIPY